MRLNTDITGILASRAKLAVLKYLLNPGFTATGREFARLCGISHTQAIRILKEFEGMNLASYSRAGKSALWRVKTGSYAYLRLDRLLGKKESHVPLEYLKTMLKNGLKNRGVRRAEIFGSMAGKKERVSSDIALFILVKDAKAARKLEKTLEKMTFKCLELFGNQLSPYLLTEKEFAKKKKLALFKNIEGGINVI